MGNVKFKIFDKSIGKTTVFPQNLTFSVAQAVVYHQIVTILKADAVPPNGEPLLLTSYKLFNLLAGKFYDNGLDAIATYNSIIVSMIPILLCGYGYKNGSGASGFIFGMVYMLTRYAQVGLISDHLVEVNFRQYFSFRSQHRKSNDILSLIKVQAESLSPASLALAVMLSTSVFTGPLALAILSTLLLINSQLLFCMVVPAVLLNIKSLKTCANLNLLAIPVISVFFTVYTGRYINPHDSTVGSDDLMFPFVTIIRQFTGTIKPNSIEEVQGMAKQIKEL